MILCLDVGNTQIYAGVFEGDKSVLSFRHTSSSNVTSDQIGLFLKSALRENGVEPESIKHIAIATVVPQLLHSLTNCCLKYFSIRPFVLQAGVKTGLKINYRNPVEVGADRIANSIAGIQLYPDTNLVIVDFGTATTFDVVNRQKEYHGGVIFPGLKLSMEVLESKTARLPSVEILRPKQVVGRSTVESIQSGLYFSHYFTVKGMIEQIQKEFFHGDEVKVIGTGGFARLYEDAQLFDEVEPDLVLKGLVYALQSNL